MASRRFIEDAIEVGGSLEPVFFGEATWLADFNALLVGLVAVSRIRMTLRRQLGTALRAAALEHEAAGFRRHPGPESVGSGALQFAGLIGAFHEP